MIRGATDRTGTGRIYVDSSSAIYWIERIEPYASASAPLWEALQSGRREVETSELTLLEVLVKPLKDNNSTLAKVYQKTLLETVGLSCRPIDREILIRRHGSARYFP